MESFKRTEAAKNHLADVYGVDRERIEKLRKILETQENRLVSFEDAQQVGADLIRIYSILAGGKKIINDVRKN